MIKKIIDIKRHEWIAYEWIDVTENRNKERRYQRNRERPIEDAPAVAAQFDCWIDAVRGVEAEKRLKEQRTGDEGV